MQDRKLDALTSVLTARQRAILRLRAWCADEEPDDRLIRLCPPQDKAEMDRIVRAVEHANGEANGALILWLEWLANTESDLHWHRALSLFHRRQVQLEQVARKPVAPLPLPWDHERLVPLGWGRLVHDEEPGAAPDWAEFVRRSGDALRVALSLRWRDVRATEAAFARLTSIMGEELIHAETKRLLEGLREHTLRLRDEMVAFGEACDLPSEFGDHIAYVQESIDWPAVQVVPPEKHAREWMAESQRQELEAWERQQAEQLRTGA